MHWGRSIAALEWGCSAELQPYRGYLNGYARTDHYLLYSQPQPGDKIRVVDLTESSNINLTTTTGRSAQLQAAVLEGAVIELSVA